MKPKRVNHIVHETPFLTLHHATPGHISVEFFLSSKAFMRCIKEVSYTQLLTLHSRLQFVRSISPLEVISFAFRHISEGNPLRVIIKLREVHNVHYRTKTCRRKEPVYFGLHICPSFSLFACKLLIIQNDIVSYNRQQPLRTART
ncbi:hypothetical protein ABW19_dt0208589 [Dactylella cylindrospora]|nr:hypothetical protein ABW19_dt0208589 [Dactylella cylindrospora]